MKATEQCFPEVLFIRLYKVVLTFDGHLDQRLTSSAFLQFCLFFKMVSFCFQDVTEAEGMSLYCREAAESSQSLNEELGTVKTQISQVSAVLSA